VGGLPPESLQDEEVPLMSHDFACKQQWHNENLSAANSIVQYNITTTELLEVHFITTVSICCHLHGGILASLFVTRRQYLFFLIYIVQS
jgi:hypothetical protein